MRDKLKDSIARFSDTFDMGLCKIRWSSENNRMNAVDNLSKSP